MASLNKLEETTSQRRADLESIIADNSKGIVTRNKANAELAILLSEDPSSLRAARIKQAAVERKSAEAASKSKDAVIQAEKALHCARAAGKEANSRREIAAQALRSAEEAIPMAQDAFIKASNTLEEIKNKHKSGRGTIFFLNADLNEQKKFLPRSQFVVAQKRANEAIQCIFVPSSS